MPLQVQRIVVSKEAEAGFRRRALRAYPLEFIEALWGTIKGNTAHIDRFAPLKHKATSRSVRHDKDDLHEQYEQAKKVGLEVLGSIHTHPGLTDAVFSESDLRALVAQERPDRIMAVCAIEKGKQRNRVRISYWPAVLPMKVEYTEQKRRAV